MAERQSPDHHLTALASAMMTEPPDQKALLENGFALLSGLLYDVKRIADAMEKIASDPPPPEVKA